MVRMLTRRGIPVRLAQTEGFNHKLSRGKKLEDFREENINIFSQIAIQYSSLGEEQQDPDFKIESGLFFLKNGTGYAICSGG